jgi:hypothetical protein
MLNIYKKLNVFVGKKGRERWEAEGGENGTQGTRGTGGRGQKAMKRPLKHD